MSLVTALGFCPHCCAMDLSDHEVMEFLPGFRSTTCPALTKEVLFLDGNRTSIHLEMFWSEKSDS